MKVFGKIVIALALLGGLAACGGDAPVVPATNPTAAAPQGQVPTAAGSAYPVEGYGRSGAYPVATPKP